MKRKVSILILFFAIFSIVVTTLLIKRKNDAKVPHVITYIVEKSSIAEVLETTGTVIPTRSQLFTGEGQVDEVLVNIGDSVKNKDLLATYTSGQKLHASFDGTVTTVNISAQELDYNFSIGQPSIQVDDLSSLKIQTNLPKFEAAKVAKDQEVLITNGDVQFKGAVSFIQPVAKKVNLENVVPVLPIEISFSDEPLNLISGFDVDLEIMVIEKKDVLTLPIESLLYQKNNTPFIYIVENNKTKKKNIQTGIQSSTHIEVLSGLQERDEVIIMPDSSLEDGMLVTK